MRHTETLTPLDKIRSNLEILANKEEPLKLAVFVSTGAYCPIHLQHFDIFNLARQVMEEKHQFHVIGGFISPSHESYLTWKLPKSDVISTEHRINMAELAVASSQWVSVSRWESQLPGFVDFPDIVKSIETYISTQFPKFTISTFCLCGADHVLKTGLLYQNQLKVVAVSRPSVALEWPKIVDAKKNPHFYVVQSDVEADVSSTMIRKRMQCGEPFEELTGEPVARYITQHVLPKKI